MANRQFSIIDSAQSDSVHSLFKEWLQLEDQFPLLSYLQSPSWHSAVHSYLTATSPTWFVVVREASKLILVLPLERAELDVGLNISLPILQVPAHPHIPLFDILFDDNLDQGFVNEMCDCLRNKLNFSWWFIRFNQLSESSKILNLLNHSEPRRQRHEITKGSAYIDIGDSFESSVAHIKGKFLRNVRRQQRKAESRGQINFHCYKERHELAEAYKAFLEVEAAGWKGREKTAIKYDTQLVEFYRSLLERKSDNYQPQINILTIGDKVVAAQLGIRTGDKLSLLKIGYDEQFSDCGPGNLILKAAIEHSVEGGIKRIAFVTDPPWAVSWLSGKEIVYDVTLFGGNIRSSIAKYGLLLKGKVKQLLSHSSRKTG